MHSGPIEALCLVCRKRHQPPMCSALYAIERVRKLAISIQGESLGEWDASAAILAALEGKP